MSRAQFDKTVSAIAREVIREERRSAYDVGVSPCGEWVEEVSEWTDYVAEYLQESFEPGTVEYSDAYAAVCEKVRATLDGAA